MSLIFSLVFLFSIAIAPAAYAANGDLGNGTGDESSPYLIEDAQDLVAFRKKVNDGQTDAYAILTADIENLSSVEDNWTPIGNSNAQYKGTFDGGGHAISGLYVNTSSDHVGFFGYVGEGGFVKNLTIADRNVSGSYNVGGIVGWNDGGTVQNCTNSADVSGEKYVGGIVGDNYGGTVQNCANSGRVSNTDSNVGGIVGENYNGTVQNCGYLKNDDVNSDVENAVGSNRGNEPVNVGTFSDADELNNIVFKLTPLIDGEEFDENTIYSMAKDGKMEISFKAWPGNFAGAYSKDGVEIKYPSDNDLVSFKENDGTITVTGLGSTGYAEIEVTTKLYTYEFSNGSYNTSSEPTEKTYIVKVDLVAAETPGDEETGGDNDEEETGGGDSGSTESGGASGGSGGGGCNAGTGALALLALIPLAMRRKR